MSICDRVEIVASIGGKFPGHLAQYSMPQQDIVKLFPAVEKTNIRKPGTLDTVSETRCSGLKYTGKDPFGYSVGPVSELPKGAKRHIFAPRRQRLCVLVNPSQNAESVYEHWASSSTKTMSES